MTVLKALNRSESGDQDLHSAGNQVYLFQNYDQIVCRVIDNVILPRDID